jgi:hypothetical protein
LLTPPPPLPTNTIQASTATKALTEANAAIDTAATSIEGKDAAIKTQEEKLVEQKAALADKTAALKVCEASECGKPTWVTMTASLGSTKKAEKYVVSPGGGGRLSIGTIGFTSVIQELGNWNQELVECVYAQSDGSKTVKTQTDVIDGEFDSSQMLACDIPAIVRCLFLD